MDRLRGKVAVITGGASGIGLVAATLFAAEGARVVIGDLREEDATRAAEGIVSPAGMAIGMGVDVMQEASLHRLIDTAVSEFGRLDIMCNHVGGSNPRTDLDAVGLDLDEFDKTMHLNVRSTLLGCRLAIPHLIEADAGSIVNTASVGGLAGDFVQLAYGTAKAAVIRMTQDVANVMLFLASDESRYVTGQLIVVDGGMMSHTPIAETRRP